MRSTLLAAAAIAVTAGPLQAQTGPRSDVELLGEIHGTTPPASYYRLKARDPDAFTFARGLRNRNPSLRSVGIDADGRPRYEMVRPARRAEGMRSLAMPGGHEVTGTINIPVVLGLFSDSPQTPPFTVDDIQREFFDGPNDRSGTVTDYYHEVSGGRVTLKGVTLDWVRSSLSEAAVTQGESALPGRVGAFVLGLLSANRGVDWGRFDNDGPDGVPNSGDDDGYVDMLAIYHPNFGAECGGAGQADRIWSHKWDLQSATGSAYTTETDAAGGGKIRILDYTIQPVYSCDTDALDFHVINQIGVLAHELGHAFGLPDLYDTDSSAPNHQGIGEWGLMGSGSWGCPSEASPGPERPCHMSAWSKEQLGWVDVVQLAPGTDLAAMTFEPVETSGTVYRIDDPGGSNEYLLLEYRTAHGFDRDLVREGLLAWHIDWDWIAQRATGNRVNADPDHMGVYLLQADGRNDLGSSRQVRGNRGDAGDPFPGLTDNTALHAASSPATRTRGGSPFGLTLEGIGTTGGELTADLFAGFRSLTLEAVGDDRIGAFAVDGAPVDAHASFAAAPYQTLAIEAAPGGGIADGVRVGFEGWADDPDAGAGRVFEMPNADATLTAAYGGAEVRSRFAVEGEQFGVPPGTVEMSPEPRVEGDELWFPEGAAVTLEVFPTTGYGFVGWSGALADQGNPASFVADEPRDFGAVFELTYGASSVSLEIEAARHQQIILQAENGDSPVLWTALSGALPAGLELQEIGRISGAATETGTFSLTVRAVDGNGLEATADIELEVTDPVLGVADLAADFIGTSGSLDELERAYLDLRGNDNGSYDLGDFRAWVLAHPDLPATVEERALVRTLLPTIRFQPGGGR